MTGNRDKIAEKLREFGQAAYELADALLDQPQVPSAVGGSLAASVSAAAPPADDYPEMSPFETGGIVPTDVHVSGPSPMEPQGSLAVCPKHRRPYSEGRFGPYCQSPSDDPAWSNSKGFCKITPKNVDVWLRAQAA